MKTEELVALLAAGVEPVDLRARARAAAVVLSLGILAAVSLMAGLLGVRPDLAREAALPAFWTRELFCTVLAFAGFACLRRVGRPGARLGKAPIVLCLTIVAMWLLAAGVLFQAAPAQRLGLFMGDTARVCSVLIALVSAPVFLAVIWNLRRLAPTRLRLAGGAAGLAAGAVGALVYTLHCPELAPPFVAVWYVAGVLIPALLGALAGPWLLRW